jgi:hypothetical protein
LPLDTISIADFFPGRAFTNAKFPQWMFVITKTVMFLAFDKTHFPNRVFDFTNVLSLRRQAGKTV